MSRKTDDLGITEEDDANTDEIERWAKGCIHYDALERQSIYRPGTGCARGVEIEKIAVAANKGSHWNIGPRLPCDGCSDDLLFTCSWFSERGIDQARDEIIAVQQPALTSIEAIVKRMSDTGQSDSLS